MMPPRLLGHLHSLPSLQQSKGYSEVSFDQFCSIGTVCCIFSHPFKAKQEEEEVKFKLVQFSHLETSGLG